MGESIKYPVAIGYLSSYWRCHKNERCANEEKRIALATSMAITPCMAHAQIVLNVRTISLAAAQEAALDQCRKNGFVVTVTLLDCRGRSKVMLHGGDANSHTSKQPAQGVYKYKPHYPRTSRGVRQAPDRRSEIGRDSQSRKHDLDRGWAPDHDRQGPGRRLAFPALPAATRTRCVRKPALTASQKASAEVKRGHHTSPVSPGLCGAAGFCRVPLRGKGVGRQLVDHILPMMQVSVWVGGVCRKIGRCRFNLGRV
ncbi:MAG TPA: hypothetical protein VL051_02855 [Burkholderiaceae bacterium]|nr:hypothetical protein [Burkholderiaceae bacterium]